MNAVPDALPLDAERLRQMKAHYQRIVTDKNVQEWLEIAAPTVEGSAMPYFWTVMSQIAAERGLTR